MHTILALTRCVHTHCMTHTSRYHQLLMVAMHGLILGFYASICDTCLCLEFTVCESLTPASEMKDSLTLDALPATETDTVLSNVRKSSLPDGTQKTSKPPVPVFRKRTSAGNCVVTDCTAGVQEQSTVGSLSDSVTSAKCDPKSVRSDQKSPVKSNGLRSDTTTVSDDTSGVSQNVSLSCRQQATPTPSLLSAVLATSAASIAMITSQAPSPTHSAAVKQRNGNIVVLLVLILQLYCWQSQLVTEFEIVVAACVKFCYVQM